MKNLPIPRLDKNPELYQRLLSYCRLKQGGVWEDPLGKHRIGCLNAASRSDTENLLQTKKATLAIQDPPYNLIAFELRGLAVFISWCRNWVANTERALNDNSSLYVWLGADQNFGFQPLPDFILMMRETLFKTRSLITMRNQRGYGTHKNWMAVRQELLYYIKGEPAFNVEAEYTDIPKILRGYYKEINGRKTENFERSKSENIRAGNVWVDVQQVFYRMEENVNGCYAQKPLKSCERIIRASSNEGDIVLDFFCHSGSTLISSEIWKRKCYTIDIDPVFCEIAIRRLEHFRNTRRTGWQNGNPFEAELAEDVGLREMIAGAQDSHEQPQATLF
ncbi:MAG: site-specific DNA-methyltransferase [Acidobacteriota bacterium]|nr:site-specific DNA-methyltransferase [Acidobacteriota bacterium]